MSERLDVVGIGNAMVDAIIPSNQNEIEKHNINRDSMNLIDENQRNDWGRILRKFNVWHYFFWR